jgi:molybdate transport system regulatory protein
MTAMTTFRLRILFGDAMLGPGKADLLEHIRDTGSIAAAGRRMGMSYKRAWSLVEELNAAFTAPLVHSARGGSGGGGAHLTPTGQEVLRLYRAIVAEAQTAAAADVATLETLLRPGDISAGT